MTDAIAAALDALDAHGVRYETTATDTIVEAETPAAAFEAARAAHEAVPGARVVTSVEIDDDRTQHQGIAERVASVERARQRYRRQSAPPTGQRAGRTNAADAAVRRRTPASHPAAASGSRSGHGRRYVDVPPAAPTP